MLGSLPASALLWFYGILSGTTHFVLLVVWYPLMKASFVLKGFQGWIPACTLICVFYSLIHQLYPGDLRKQYTILQRGSQPVSEASKANSSASDWRWACVPRWPGFPQDTGWTKKGQCLFLWASPKFNWKATAGSEAGLSFSLPGCQFLIWTQHCVPLA